MSIILLIIGIAVLVYGADKLVDALTSLALKCKIPKQILGLTLMSLGTGLPELVVAFQSMIQGNSGITIGNVVGSNIQDILGSDLYNQFLSSDLTKDDITNEPIYKTVNDAFGNLLVKRFNYLTGHNELFWNIFNQDINSSDEEIRELENVDDYLAMQGNLIASGKYPVANLLDDNKYQSFKDKPEIKTLIQKINSDNSSYALRGENNAAAEDRKNRLLKRLNKDALEKESTRLIKKGIDIFSKYGDYNCMKKSTYKMLIFQGRP